MDYTTQIIGGLLIAVVSGIIGKLLGSSGKVAEKHCDERQASCQRLLIEKIDNVGKKVDSLAKIVNEKILNL